MRIIWSLNFWWKLLLTGKQWFTIGIMAPRVELRGWTTIRSYIFPLGGKFKSGTERLTVRKPGTFLLPFFSVTFPMWAIYDPHLEFLVSDACYTRTKQKNHHQWLHSGQKHQLLKQTHCDMNLIESCKAGKTGKNFWNGPDVEKMLNKKFTMLMGTGHIGLIQVSVK